LAAAVRGVLEALAMMPDALLNPRGDRGREAQPNLDLDLVHHAPGGGEIFIWVEVGWDNIAAAQDLGSHDPLKLEGAQRAAQVVVGDNIRGRLAARDLQEVWADHSLGQRAAGGAIVDRDAP